MKVSYSYSYSYIVLCVFSIDVMSLHSICICICFYCIVPGEWKAGKRHGKGTLRFANGEIFSLLILIIDMINSR